MAGAYDVGDAALPPILRQQNVRKGQGHRAQAQAGYGSQSSGAGYGGWKASAQRSQAKQWTYQSNRKR